MMKIVQSNLGQGHKVIAVDPLFSMDNGVMLENQILLSLRTYAKSNNYLSKTYKVLHQMFNPISARGSNTRKQKNPRQLYSIEPKSSVSEVKEEVVEYKSYPVLEHILPKIKEQTLVLNSAQEATNENPLTSLQEH